MEYGFNKQVQEHLGGVRVSRSLISMVRHGKRKNDAILMAIIETDHNLKRTEYNQQRKGLEWFL